MASFRAAPFFGSRQAYWGGGVAGRRSDRRRRDERVHRHQFEEGKPSAIRIA